MVGAIQVNQFYQELFQTSPNYKFNQFFATMETNFECDIVLDGTGKKLEDFITVEQICKLATSKGNELNKLTMCYLAK